LDGTNTERHQQEAAVTLHHVYAGLIIPSKNDPNGQIYSLASYLLVPTVMFTLVLFLVVYAARTQAIYYMDDRNSSISYTGEHSWVQILDGGALDETL